MNNTSNIMIQGPELLSKYEELSAQGLNKTEICKVCGYEIDGKVKYTMFFENLLIAKGVIMHDEEELEEVDKELTKNYPTQAIKEFIEYFGKDQLNAFPDAYMGELSGSEFAKEMLTDCFGLDVPHFVAIDWESTWDNLSDDYVELDGYIFCLNF